MELYKFINELLTEGSVTVAGEIITFAPTDRQKALGTLERFHHNDSLEMPGQAPAFDPDAALWALEYLYHAIQLALLRNLDETEVDRLLQPYPAAITAEAIYAVDLSFRYLGDILGLAKGLAPDDPLVVKLRETAARWPFSTTGMKLEMEVDATPVLAHPSLRIAYTDRIIAARNLERLNTDDIRTLVYEALGNYAGMLWPNLENDIHKKTIHTNDASTW